MTTHQQWPGFLQRLYDAIETKNKKLESNLSSQQQEQLKNNAGLLYYGADQCAIIAREHPDWPDDLVDILVEQRVLELLQKPIDLITQAAAAEIVGVSLQRIHNAIRDRRLVGYKNPEGKIKHGAQLVSQAAVLAINWKR